MADEQNPQDQESRKLDQSDPQQKPFTPESLDRTVIAIPLLKTLEAEAAGTITPTPHKVIIDLNLEFPGGREAARN
jgi:serine protease AprX